MIKEILENAAKHLIGIVTLGGELLLLVLAIMALSALISFLVFMVYKIDYRRTDGNPHIYIQKSAYFLDSWSDHALLDLDAATGNVVSVFAMKKSLGTLPRLVVKSLVYVVSSVFDRMGNVTGTQDLHKVTEEEKRRV